MTQDEEQISCSCDCAPDLGSDSQRARIDSERFQQRVMEGIFLDKFVQFLRTVNSVLVSDLSGPQSHNFDALIGVLYIRWIFAKLALIEHEGAKDSNFIIFLVSQYCCLNLRKFPERCVGSQQATLWKVKLGGAFRTKVLSPGKFPIVHNAIMLREGGLLPRAMATKACTSPWWSRYGFFTAVRFSFSPQRTVCVDVEVLSSISN